MKTGMLPPMKVGTTPALRVRRLACSILLLCFCGCASDALSIEPPNVIDVTPEPGIVSVGESVRIDFYPQTQLPEGENASNRTLDPSALAALGMVIERWVFEHAFDFSVSVVVSEQASTGLFTVEIPIANEYSDFIIRFDLQVTR